MENIKFLINYLAIILFIGCNEAGIVHRQPLKTWKDLKEENIVMQKFDFSCGASALATLMKYYFQEEVTEKMIIEDIFSHLPKSEWDGHKYRGLSLLELKQFAERRGYQAYGIRLKLDALSKLTCPILVHLEVENQNHFAILRGVREDRVLLADPSRGNIKIPIAKFKGEWKKGMALVIQKNEFAPPTNHPLSIDNEPPERLELKAVRKSLYLRKY